MSEKALEAVRAEFQKRYERREAWRALHCPPECDGNWSQCCPGCHGKIPDDFQPGGEEAVTSISTDVWVLKVGANFIYYPHWRRPSLTPNRRLAHRYETPREAMADASSYRFYCWRDSLRLVKLVKKGRK